MAVRPTTSRTAASAAARSVAREAGMGGERSRRIGAIIPDASGPSTRDGGTPEA